MTAAALLALFGMPAVAGSVTGIMLSMLTPGRVKLSANVLKAAVAGLKHLEAPDRDPTHAEVEAMQRMDMFS